MYNSKFWPSDVSKWPWFLKIVAVNSCCDLATLTSHVVEVQLGEWKGRAQYKNGIPVLVRDNRGSSGSYPEAAKNFLLKEVAGRPYQPSPGPLAHRQGG